jgi:hypothetical protein
MIFILGMKIALLHHRFSSINKSCLEELQILRPLDLEIITMTVFKKILAATLILACGAANATLINQGATTKDTATGYIWYDLSATTGISYNQMQANFANASSAYYGYQFAKQADIATVVQDAGSIQSAFNLFGQTGNNCCARADGFYDDGNSNQMAGLAYLIPSMFTDTRFAADFTSKNTTDWSGTGNLVGNWIYKREAINAVPEPSILLLFALGAMSALYFRRRT